MLVRQVLQAHKALKGLLVLLGHLALLDLLVLLVPQGQPDLLAHLALRVLLVLVVLPVLMALLDPRDRLVLQGLDRKSTRLNSSH